MPELYLWPNNFDGFIKGGECLRYYLDIEADNFTSKKSQVFEVAWTGGWSKDRDEMRKHVSVREVSPDELDGTRN